MILGVRINRGKRQLPCLNYDIDKLRRWVALVEREGSMFSYFLASPLG